MIDVSRFAAGPTYAHRIADAMRRFASRPALEWKEGGAWRQITYAETDERILDCAAALRRRGIAAGDRVSIWLETSWPWIVMDFAAQRLGAITAPIYHTLPAVQAGAILRDAGSRALLATPARLASLEGQGLLGRLVDVPVDASRFGVFLDEGRAAREADPALAREVVGAPPVRPDDLSAIIYTSGTTGEPKGAMLTHASVVANVDGAIAGFQPPGALERVLLHLPLAHVMARNTAVAATLLTGGTLVLAEPEREKLPANLVETAPLGFITVPYLLDKFMGRVVEMVEKKGAIGRALARRAFALGRRVRVGALPPEGGAWRPPPLGVELGILDRLVLAKVRARLGGRLRLIVVGGASASRESLEFFWGLGIPVYEGYGATEVTNCAAFNFYGQVKLGTVGRAAPGMEVRLAEDGEVLVRGPNVMRGYWGKAEATREAIDAEGWYRTGDIGALDAQGYLRIVDRKKEVFALATGKKVAPQAVENALKLSACIANACAIGDQRRYVAALVVPDLEVVRARLGLEAPPAADDPRVRAMIAAEIEHVTAGLADFERPKRFAVLGEAFSQENDLLTPTLKLKRRKVAERFAKEIEGLYDREGVPALSVRSA